jgi:hypothetical protein
VICCLPPSKPWCVAACAVAIALLGACADSESRSQMKAQKMQAQEDLRRFRDAAQQAVHCRAEAAQNSRYQVLSEHMPLTDLDDATLSQMTDKNFATDSEIAALDAWTRDMNRCLEALVREANATIPSFGPVVEASWNDDTVVFVKLAHREMTWGEAVIRLKSNTIKMRADLIARADQVSAQISKVDQTEYNRSTSIITSIIGLLP